MKSDSARLSSLSNKPIGESPFVKYRGFFKGLGSYDEAYLYKWLSNVASWGSRIRSRYDG